VPGSKPTSLAQLEGSKLTTNHASPLAHARHTRRQPSPWRPFAVVFGLALTALLATIVFIACSGTPPTPPDATGTPNSPTATPTAVSTDGTIATGVTVNGVGIGGMTIDDARMALANALTDVSAGKLTINIGALNHDITYASVSRAYDIEATLQNAFAATGGEVAAVTTYNADALAQQVNDFVATAQAAPVNATISYENGQYVLTSAVDGQSVDAAVVLTDAGSLMANGNPADQVLDVQATTIPADINSEAAQAAIDHAEAVTNTPLTITAGGQSFVVDSAALHNWVQLEETTPGVWTLKVDETAVTAYIDTIKTQVDQPAVDAEWHFGDAVEPIVTPSQTGYEVDAAAAVSQIESTLAAATGPVGTIALSVIATEPDFTTAEAQAQAGNVQLLGTWTTHYIPSHFNGDGVNIRRPASLIDGTVIGPGKLFDFYRLTGPYTEANGYTDGAAIIHGNTKGEGVLGGGLCSASTTMFNAALRAGFQMGARYNHAYFITRYPVGLDATIWVSGNSVKNMTFTNDSKYPIVIRTINKKRAVTFQVWGVGDGRTVNLADPIVSNETEAQQLYKFTDTLPARQTERTEFGADGFNSIVSRTVRDRAGAVIHQDTFRSNYRTVNGIVMVGRCNGDPASGQTQPLDQPLPNCGGGGPTPTPKPTQTPGPTSSPVAPHADFNWHQVNGTMKISFGNDSSGGNLTYDWDFGDGVHSTAANPTHNYKNAGPGDYQVTLTVTNGAGTDSKGPLTVHVDAVATPAPTGSPAPTPCDPPASPCP
jgi:vancomycin resistance protein YoaR